MSSRDAGEKALRAKYLDWCSARIADRFLELTPEQIYELALGEGGDRGVAVPSGGTAAPGLGSEELGRSYRRLVERVTEVLATRLALPEFDAWAEVYRSDPERYEAELLGFWRGADAG